MMHARGTPIMMLFGILVIGAIMSGLASPLLPVVVTLAAAGIALSYARAHEADAHRRVALVFELGRLAASRASLDESIAEVARLLGSYLGTDRCTILLASPEPGFHLLHERGQPRPGFDRVDDAAVAPLLALPDSCAVPYRARRVRRSITTTPSNSSNSIDPAICTAIADLLEAKAFISVPLRSRDIVVGRIFVADPRRRADAATLETCMHAGEQIALIVEHRRLLSSLADEVARSERERISRDLHDGTIQPYIGLKLGLDALRRRMSPDDPLSGHLDDLARMASDSITELRRYVNGLREAKLKQKTTASFVAAVRRQADLFAQVSGITVHVNASADIEIRTGHLEELMQIVREGLSNVRRHTSAAEVDISVRDAGSRIELEIANDNPCGDEGAAPFLPRSLCERARDLGGTVEVERRKDGRTAVVVGVPM